MIIFFKFYQILYLIVVFKYYAYELLIQFLMFNNIYNHVCIEINNIRDEP